MMASYFSITIGPARDIIQVHWLTDPPDPMRTDLTWFGDSSVYFPRLPAATAASTIGTRSDIQLGAMLTKSGFSRSSISL